MVNTPYTCFRCGYETKIRNSMNRHLYLLQKTCPGIQHNEIELTNEIKDCIMKHRVYCAPPKTTVPQKKYDHVLKDKQQDTIKLEIQKVILKHSRPETFYQSVVERYLHGTHKKLESGYVTDISTEDTHVEIKNWKKFRKSIGTLISYNVEDHKPYLQVYLFGTKTNKIKEVATRIFKSLDIKMFTFDIDTKHVDIIDLDTNKKVFTCHIYNDELITTYVEIPKTKAKEEQIYPTTPEQSIDNNDETFMIPLILLEDTI